MTALILDAGALLAIDRDDRTMIARLRVAQQSGLDLRSNAMVVAQVWRDRRGRQANLARLLHAIDVRAVRPSDGREREHCSLTRAPQTRSTLPLPSWPLRATGSSPATPVA
jgi:hypothetical protein